MKRKIYRFITVLLSLILLLTSTSFSAEMLAGDINRNAKIEASDARLALRFSVGLEEFDNEQLILGEVDGKSGITAADARIILRMSVGLEEQFTIGNGNENSSFEVHFIDVGQADCSLILCDGESLLIDGGNVGDGSLVVSHLIDVGIEELDYVICTHAHEDHVGGLSETLENFTVSENIFAPATGAETKCYENFLSASEKQGKILTVPEVGYTFSLGESTVEFIGPVTEDYSDINNTSLVTKITYGETSFLFTGDMERESEEDILEAGIDVSADVLKVGHHGSENSTTYPFLREVMPEIAVISVGEGNDYGHPTEEALSRLRDADVKVYRTDMQGNIIISSDGNELSVKTAKNQNIETNPTVPIPPAEKISYIGNINSLKFHSQDCSSLPKEENRIYFANRDAAVANGYSPCSKCKP